jgi:hypothetical protein
VLCQPAVIPSCVSPGSHTWVVVAWQTYQVVLGPRQSYLGLLPGRHTRLCLSPGSHTWGVPGSHTRECLSPGSHTRVALCCHPAVIPGCVVTAVIPWLWHNARQSYRSTCLHMLQKWKRNAAIFFAQHVAHHATYGVIVVACRADLRLQPRQPPTRPGPVRTPAGA